MVVELGYRTRLKKDGVTETLNSILADGRLATATAETAVREVRAAVTARPAGTAALSRRAILVGLLLVAFVAAFTPYNDYILHNSPFIGNHFPIGIVTLMAVLILAVNPALAWMKRRSLATGELIVIMTMMLVGAAVPSSGLMRYLEPMVVAPFHHIQ